MKRYFITGLLIWVPLGITAWALRFLIGTMDQSLLLLPENLRPEALVGIYVPGVGTVLTLLVVFLTGLLTTNIIGQRLVIFWEGVLWRIPVVKSIYYGSRIMTRFPSREAFAKRWCKIRVRFVDDRVLLPRARRANHSRETCKVYVHYTQPTS